jgi:hypothetical protein
MDEVRPEMLKRAVEGVKKAKRRLGNLRSV